MGFNRIVLQLVPVNPSAAETKPKIQVAKKANILNQLPHTAPVETARSAQQEQPRAQQQRATPKIDDDMGIVRVEQSSRHQAPRQEVEQQAANPMIPKQQVSSLIHTVTLSFISKVQLKARERHDDEGSSQTSGQVNRMDRIPFLPSQ